MNFLSMLTPAALDLNLPAGATAAVLITRLELWFRESTYREDMASPATPLIGYYEWDGEMGEFEEPKHRDIVLPDRYRLQVELVTGTESYILHVNLVLPLEGDTSGPLWKGRLIPVFAAKCCHSPTQFETLAALTRLLA